MFIPVFISVQNYSFQYKNIYLRNQKTSVQLMFSEDLAGRLQKRSDIPYLCHIEKSQYY